MATIVRETTLSESRWTQLRGSPLFSDFNEEQTKAFHEAFAKPKEEIIVKEFDAGELICGKGEFSLDLCVVLSGQVIYRGESFGPGEFFGEDGAIGGIAKDADVTAVTDSLLLCIPPAALKWIEVNDVARKLIGKRYEQRAIEEATKDLVLFAGAPPDFITAVASHAELERIATGEQLIISEGLKPDALYIIRSGFAKAFHHRKDGTDRVVAYMRAGDFFGENPLVDDQPSPWSVQTADRCELIKLPHEPLRDLVRKYPEVSARARAFIAERQHLELELTPDKIDQVERWGQKNLILSDALLVMDLDLCVKCDNCVRACESLHGVSRLIRTGIHIEQYLVPSACRHCDDPKCMTACPTGAVKRRPHGEIYFEYDLCIGCANCAIACPYDNIAMIDTDTFDRAQRHKASVLHDAKIYSPTAAAVPVTPDSPLDGGLLRSLFGGSAASASTPRPVPVDGAAIPPQFPIKCDLCDGLPIMGCVHNCPTGAAIRMNATALSESINDATAISRVSRAGKGNPPRRGLATAFALVLGAIVAIYYRKIAAAGADHEYLTGVLTLVAFALAALYSVRKRSPWFSVVWLRALGVSGEKEHNFLRLLDQLRTWRAVHIAIGVAGTAAFISHMQAGARNPLETVLACAVVMLIASGYLGTLIQDLVPSLSARDETREVRLEDVAERLQEIENPQRYKDKFLGRSTELHDAFKNRIEPILHSPEPAWKLFGAFIRGADASSAACLRAWAERKTIPAADRSLYYELLDMAALKVDLEQNRFELLLSTRWLNIHVALAVVIGVLVVFHVFGVLYLNWP